MSSVISGIGGQKSSTFCCALVAAASSEDSHCFPLEFRSVGVFGEFCAVNTGNTALSKILVAFTTRSSSKRDEVDWIIDRPSGRGLTGSCR